jgi:hypothetical protein
VRPLGAGVGAGAHRRNLFSVASSNRFPNEKKTRQQLAREQRTAEYAASNPGSLVVRAQIGTGLSRTSSSVVQAIGMFVMHPRTVHLVADASGIRAMQSLRESEWDKRWSEVVSIEVVGNAPTLLELNAVGWHDPKLYVICKPDGEPVAPGEVPGVVRRLRELSTMRHRADSTPPSE